MKGQGGWFGGGGGGGNFGNDYSYGGGGYDGYGFGGKGGGKESKGGGKGSIPCKFYQKGSCTRGTTCAFSHDEASGQEGPPGGKGSQPGGKWFGGDDEDPELAEIQDALAMQQLDDDEKMRAEMAEMDEPPPSDNASEGSDPPLPPPASEQEIAEAQEIVKRAQDDLIERNKMKAKVKDANKSDLQAMINARLAKRWRCWVELSDAKMIGQDHMREADEA